MSVKLRMARHGAKTAPYYRIVVADSDAPRDGRFIETVGTYDPRKETDSEKYRVKEDRILEWLGKGAQPTRTVISIMRKTGILKKVQAPAS